MSYILIEPLCSFFLAFVFVGWHDCFLQNGGCGWGNLFLQIVFCLGYHYPVNEDLAAGKPPDTRLQACRDFEGT